MIVSKSEGHYALLNVPARDFFRSFSRSSALSCHMSHLLALKISNRQKLDGSDTLWLKMLCTLMRP